MKMRWIVAPLVALLGTVSGFAQQGDSLPPIVSGSSAKIQQSTSFPTTIYSDNAGMSTTGNVYTPVAPMNANPMPYSAGTNWGNAAAGGGYDSGCGVNGCGDCAAECGCCDRYFSMYGGWNRLLDYNGTIPALATSVNGSFDDGYGMGSAVGRYLTPRLRSELDFTYRHNEGDEWTATGGQTGPQTVTGPLDGDVDCFSGMANFFVDFGGREMGRVTPYAGAGAGFAFVEADFQAAGFQFAVDDSAFAYQGIVGLLFPMGARADWFCEYRYFCTDTLIANNLTDGSNSEYDYRAHDVFFGIRFCR